MCGIAGWFDPKGQRLPDRSLVRAMSNAIRHRGPDGDGFYFEPGLGFGHRRLAVIDLVSGDQPMHSQDGNLCLSSTVRFSISANCAPTLNSAGVPSQPAPTPR